MSFREKYSELAQRLLGRPLNGADGVSASQLNADTRECAFHLPAALSDYYAVVGNLPINVAHNRLLPLKELHLDPEEEVMVFMDENQSVCAWGIRIEDLSLDDPTVYQGQPDEGDWHSEECTTSEWMEICFYLQCCWGGLEFCYGHMNPKSVLPQIRRDWQKVVEHNGLTIWEEDGVLVSYMGQPWCDGAANSQAGLEKLQQLGFSE